MLGLAGLLSHCAGEVVESASALLAGGTEALRIQFRREDLRPDEPPTNLTIQVVCWNPEAGSTVIFDGMFGESTVPHISL